MASISWFIKRLKAMSIAEVLWRFSQKNIQKQEERKFAKKNIAVISKVFNSELTFLQAHGKNLHINFTNINYVLNTSIKLLAGANYEDYKTKWNAGFQTDSLWPYIFSYNLEYKQRDDIGDARTNWELNRHFQFVILAKDYAASSNKKYLMEFEELFLDWNKKNSFLCGIAWTSVMEIAIRCSNWCYAYAFLEHSRVSMDLLRRLQNGILNMTDYITNHYSRFSSANNHLIVEAYAVGQSGILFNRKEWINFAVDILTRELPLQNYSDGVNKELSLHYQSFYMEAMGLMIRLLVKNEIDVPVSWKSMLEKMSQYVADCMGEYGEAVVFGDNDEGKILDLQGGEINHYQYVLGIMSILLDKCYAKNFNCETLNWLFTNDELKRAKNKEKYVSPQYCCYQKGGISILRSRDGKILIGIDHAALGFGSLAAHGHADALSFQLFYEGNPFFVDPGTYIYHCDLLNRNEFRKTQNHNTVCIDGKDQSKMLGAFLWGKKANSFLHKYQIENNKISVVISTDGYSPYIHKRRIEFDGDKMLKIIDEIIPNYRGEASYILGPMYHVENGEIRNLYSKKIAFFECEFGKIVPFSFYYSDKYGIKEKTKGVKIRFDTQNIVTITFI